MKIGKNRALMIAIKMRESFIYEISLSEGNAMTYAQTESTISGIVPAGVKTKDIILINNLRDGYDYMLELVKKDEFFLDKELMCKINRIVSSNDNFDNLGGFRMYPIKIGNSKHTGAKVSEFNVEFMRITSNYFDSKSESREIELFAEITKAQFFGDGNKRTSQIVMNGLLIQNGYAPFMINFRDEKFSKPLIEYYDENNIENLLRVMREKQLEVLRDFLTDNELEQAKKRKKSKEEELER